MEPQVVQRVPRDVAPRAALSTVSRTGPVPFVCPSMTLPSHSNSLWLLLPHALLLRAVLGVLPRSGGSGAGQLDLPLVVPADADEAPLTHDERRLVLVVREEVALERSQVDGAAIALSVGDECLGATAGTAQDTEVTE